MSDLFAVILTVSLALLVVELAYRVFTKRGGLLPRTLVILAGGWVVYALAPKAVQTRGSSDEIVAIVFCYFSMVLGMMAEYGYVQAERGNKKFEFDLMSFLMPIFASPIVFIPLLTLTSEVAIGGAFTRPKLMVYLVAFQNGFFWKSFFEQRRAEAAVAARSEPAAAALEREPHAA
jgi:preprotein translocase subunit SecG